MYRKASAFDPQYYDAQAAIGSALDIRGQYDEAQKAFLLAAGLADPNQKSGVLRSLAVSYAFECKTADVEKYERQAEEIQINYKRYDQAAGILNELARIDLECDQLDKAYMAYKEGFEIVSKSVTKPEDKDLWSFRWEHAQARIAARRGKKEEAAKHMAAAQAIFDKKTLPEAQAIYVPYLTGYVAFYLGDYKTALTDLQKADQKDAFILAMLAQTEEKLGDTAAAKDYWTKVLGIYSHNPPNAYARPLARKALGKQRGTKP
jgi:tetratricopeptide (TPR) repeat protein